MLKRINWPTSLLQEKLGQLVRERDLLGMLQGPGKYTEPGNKVSGGFRWNGERQGCQSGSFISWGPEGSSGEMMANGHSWVLTSSVPLHSVASAISVPFRSVGWVVMLLICSEGRAGSWSPPPGMFQALQPPSTAMAWAASLGTWVGPVLLLPLPGCLDGEGAAPEDSHPISPPALTSRGLLGHCKEQEEEAAAVGALKIKPHSEGQVCTAVAPEEFLGNTP